ncbi:hypothetical protein [uncultured Cohaesibacter sp.]|uniref:hypothetical protein n=1 Tax=uncultured Cohaesibacter sp. TaxID=1002546 RepID=UPI0029C933A7|nr:hypothetical protein [uncultured Cohaesibacter sp.]
MTDAALCSNVANVQGAHLPRLFEIWLRGGAVLLIIGLAEGNLTFIELIKEMQ